MPFFFKMEFYFLLLFLINEYSFITVWILMTSVTTVLSAYLCISFFVVNTLGPRQNSHRFSRRHFQINFLRWRGFNFEENFDEVCSHWYYQKQDSIGLGNGLSPVQPQAIIWTNYGLTHWGRVTHICVSKLTIIGSDKGLSSDRRQAII